jgi:hypothetical protein
VKWKEKCPVVLKSLINSPTDVEVVKTKESNGGVTQISCPKIVKAYTANMSCVDKADMLKTL